MGAGRLERPAIGMEHAADVPVRRLTMPRRRGRRSAPQRYRVAGTIAASLLLFALVALGAAFLRSTGEAAPGTRVGDVEVGGLSETAARARVGARTAALAEQPVAFTLGDRNWTTRPAKIGVTYEADAAVDHALAAGRDPGFAGALLGTVGMAPEPAPVPLAIRLDQTGFDRFLDQIDAEVGAPPVDAAVVLAGTDVSITPARDGRGIDRDVARSALVPLLAALRPVSVALTERALPPAIDDDEAVALQDRLDQALAEPILLGDGDETWPVAPEELAGLVRIAPVDRDGGRVLDATLDGAGLATLVDRIAAETEAATSDAWIEQRGSQKYLVPAVQGRTLLRDELVTSLRAAFLAGEHELALPVQRDAAVPEVTTDELLADLGITGLVAEGDSAFAGSDAGRDTNVRLAAERVDGALVPPGGTFSYNAALGTLFDSGFAAANSMIEGFETAEGGGVCQVSTTVFRAALRAGLPITEWWPHGFRSPFYEQAGWSPGFDASIVQVWQDPESDTDFRFENPTDSWMLVRVALEPGSGLRVDLLGAETGYGVSFDEPVQRVTEPAPPATEEIDESLLPGTVVEDRPAADALEVTVVRRVTDADGNEVSTDTFVSSYRSQSALRRVSPDMIEGA